MSPALTVTGNDTQPLLAYYARARKHDVASFARKYPDPVIGYIGATRWAPEKSFATTAQLGTMLEMRRTYGTPAGEQGARMRITLIKKSARNPFAGQIYLGRANNNDVILEHESVSKAHAFFTTDGSDWHITDAGSANGTFIKDVRVSKSAPLSDGADIRFGLCVATFWLPNGFYEFLTRTLAAN